MRDFREQNYYELLDAKPHYSAQELEQCYQRVKRFLSPDSVATYALFQPEELNLLRRRIEEAFRVLSSPERRKHYDQEMGNLNAQGWPNPVGPIWASAAQSPAEESLAKPELPKTVDSNAKQEPLEQVLPDNKAHLPTAPADSQTSDAAPGQPASADAVAASHQATLQDPTQDKPALPTLSGASVASNMTSVSGEPVKDVPTPPSRKEERDDAMETPPAVETPIVEQTAPATSSDALRPKKSETAPVPPPSAPNITSETKFTGELLKQVRQSRGFTLERVAEITKINIFYLRTIEEERYSNLPAEVYVRGYLRMVCQVYGLDTRQVTSTYLDRLPPSKS